LVGQALVCSRQSPDEANHSRRLALTNKSEVDYFYVCFLVQVLRLVDADPRSALL